MKTRFKVIVLIFVPILGLLSCSKDPKVDSWQMSEPTIEAAGQPPLTVRAASRRTLPADSALKFSGEIWSTLQVKSTCDYNGKPFQSEAAISYRDTLTLKSLWPATLWKTFSDTELAKSECAFSFLVTTASGSTQTFSLESVKLASFVNANFAAKLSTLSLTGVSSSSQPAFVDAVRSLTDTVSDDGQMTLRCANASATMTIRAAARTPNAVQSLMNQLGLHGRQLCRFIVSEANSGRDVSKFEMTNEIFTKFPAVTLTTLVEFPMRSAIEMLQQPKLNLINIKISNPGDASTFVRVDVPSSYGRRLVYRPRYQSRDMAAGGIYESAATRFSHLVTDSSGAAQIAASDQIRSFEIKPGETLSVAFHSANVDPIAIALGIAQSNGLEVNSFLGFRFGFDRPIRVVQSDSVNFDDVQTLVGFPSPGGESLPLSTVFNSWRSELGDELPLGPFTRWIIPDGCAGSSCDL